MGDRQPPRTLWERGGFVMYTFFGDECEES